MPAKLPPLSDPALGPINVGHDLDGCYYAFTTAFCVDAAEQDPKNADLYLSEAMPASHDFYTTFGWDVAEFVARYDDAMSRGVLSWPEFTFKGSVRALDRLHDVFGSRLSNTIITYRDNGATQFDGARQTAEWALAVDFPFNALIANKDKRTLGTDYFIEDSVANYWMLREAGSECFLMSRPWNTGHDVPAEHVVTSINGYVDKIIESQSRKAMRPRAA